MADVTLKIGADNAQFAAIIESTVKKLAGLQSAASSAFAPLAKMVPEIAAMAGLGAGIGGIAAEIGGVIEKGRGLSDLITRTGASGTTLLQIQKAFKVAGLEVDNVGPAIGRLQKSIAGVNEDGEDTSGVFGRLGMDLKELKGLNPSQQFDYVGQALRRLKDPAEKTQAVMQIFGKSGAEMLQLFNSASATDALTAGLSRSQQLLAANAGMYSHISRTVGAFMAQLKSSFGLFNGLAAGIAPALDNLLNKLPKIDLTGVGEQIGRVAGVLIQAFSDGKLGQLISLSLQVGFAKAGNYLFGIVQGMGGALGAVATPLGAAFQLAGMELVNLLARGVNAVGRALGAYYALLFSIVGAELSHIPTILSAMKSGLIGVIQIAGALLLDVFQKPIVAMQTGLEYAVQSMMEKLSKMPGVGKLLGLGDFKAESYDEISKRRQSEGAQLGGIGETASKLREQGENNLATAGSGVVDAFKDVDFKGGLAEIKDQFSQGAKEGGLFGDDQIDAAKQQIDPGTFLDKLTQGYKDGQEAGGGGPFDASGSQGKLDSLVGQLSAGMSGVAAKYNPAGATGQDSLQTPEKKKEAKEKAEKAKRLKDAADTARGTVEKATASGGATARAASSLSKIGGGGYAAGGGIRSIMTQQTAWLKTIAESNKAILAAQGTTRSAALTHLTPGAAGGTAAAVG